MKKKKKIVKEKRPKAFEEALNALDMLNKGLEDLHSISKKLKSNAIQLNKIRKSEFPKISRNLNTPNRYLKSIKASMPPITEPLKNLEIDAGDLNFIEEPMD